MENNTQSRKWALVINNPLEADLTTLLSGKSYIAFLRPISAWQTR